MNNAKESLDFIKSIVEDNRKVSLSSGMPSIIWGVFVIIALVATYIGATNSIQSGWYYMIAWTASCFTAWVIMFITERKKCREEVSTYSQKLLGLVWMSHGMMMMMLSLVGSVSGTINPFAISPLMGTVLGSAYFINGVLNDYQWLRIVGITWWVTSAMLFLLVRTPIGGANILLYFAGLMIFLQILPGIKLEMLWRDASRESNL
ncbi:MAG: hypothetical protein B6226_03545 [Candidatus Cloacimonetes bacterium 4572_65]|nr:MAG: hypothetical protein B6226_03545 [Candidatus Cloacimonetes bacterium 4572_65]